MDRLALLGSGDIEVVGRVVQSSNGTYVVELTSGDDSHYAIYKPVRGERPLWDFEPGLHRRERAAYVLSDWLGLGIVPPTVIREDAPMGTGSLQWFVDANFAEHYFSMYEERPALHDVLRTMCLFDIVANNTDRKGGHVLLDQDEQVWGIDQGLCFAAEDKLRTVIWDFAGEPIGEDLLAAIEPLASRVPEELEELLSVDEVAAVQRRARRLLRQPVFPHDRTGHAYPWPLV